MDIRVDMFEVQLGLSMLLQFRLSSGGIVRVLADAGIKAKGYPVDHVRRKLPSAFAAMGPGMTLDLVVGTHYDADHLDGLVPIINDPALTLREIWLPPVAATPGLDDEDLAPDLEPDLDEDALESDEEDLLEEEDGLVSADLLVGRFQRDAEGVYYDRLMRHYADRLAAIPRPGDHASFDAERFQLEDFEEELSLLQELADDDLDFDIPELADLEGMARQSRTEADGPFLGWTQEALQLSLAARATVAKTAIGATSLRNVVNAASARGIPLHCRTIAFGVPDKYGWDGSAFTLGATAIDGLELTLLGPSRTLVTKHRKLLPSVMYLTTTRPGTPAITASNQLSYTLRFAYQGQGVFVCGDAGCVDFKSRGSTSYVTALLNECVPSHVLQIAHHVGNNAHFYRVMLDAGWDTAQSPAYVLASHATLDVHRPSTHFGTFISALSSTPEILFTSKPDPTKVSGYAHLIGAVRGPGGQTGNVVLEYDAVTGWDVVSHAVSGP